MALLGTLVHRVTGQSFAANAGTAPTTSFASHIHSLPATSPESIIPVVTSVEDIAGNGHDSAMHLLACGANASVITIGVAYGSGATMPLIGYDVECLVWHSSVR